jgi:hypothetical protein
MVADGTRRERRPKRRVEPTSGSHLLIVLMKQPKETTRVAGRGRPEEWLDESREDRTQSRTTLPIPLTRVHEAASGDRKTQFTAGCTT